MDDEQQQQQMNDDEPTRSLVLEDDQYQFEDTTSVDILRFFGYGTIDDTSILDSLRYQSELSFLIGPQKSCKTSMLFQYGYTYAKQGYTVLFICDKKRFNQTLPIMPIKDVVGTGHNQSMPSHNDVYLKHIKIKYIERDSDLRQYFMEFPSLNLLPDLILIDDITSYFGLYSDRTKLIFGRTLAFLKDTLHYINTQKRNQPVKCRAIVTDSLHHDGYRYFYIIQRWASLILQIQPQVPPAQSSDTIIDHAMSDHHVVDNTNQTIQTPTKLVLQGPTTPSSTSSTATATSVAGASSLSTTAITDKTFIMNVKKYTPVVTGNNNNSNSNTIGSQLHAQYTFHATPNRYSLDNLKV
ncbi:hypothetical protein SAMD00019534_101360, partial [Acytostelium subglobosum LB1]|uniref:hypothetical protein n=1 Tax=Acytostelium subglobosum LB1 TaxID=1410327 RepID=UPI0006450045